ncbi:MAG TPA: hypothetical protein VK140_00485 [Ktedonobacteraceae bacterium]|nr:hypothetical protein [Ktedonobacteraceae bacterium]
MFNKVSYRRGVIEGVILYTLGRLGALITPAFFPDWVYVAAPLLFLVLQFLLGPVWATRRIASTKRERLSKRFWLLGPRMAALCLGIDILLSLVAGLPVNSFGGVQQGPALWRLFMVSGPNHLSLLDLGLYELRSAALLFAFFILDVICTRLAMGGFLRFTMPAEGNRVTL